jgi:hypothetical protein
MHFSLLSRLLLWTNLVMIGGLVMYDVDLRPNMVWPIGWMLFILGWVFCNVGVAAVCLVSDVVVLLGPSRATFESGKF